VSRISGCKLRPTVPGVLHPDRNAQNNLFGDNVPSWSTNHVACVGVCNDQLILLSIGFPVEVLNSTEIKYDDNGGIHLGKMYP
jgi:hypothetical protein